MAPQRSRTNEEARRSGPPVQGLTSRISSQHHRCNGKSFQCPFNVTTFRGYTLLWASALLSFPCTCYYAPIPAVRNPATPSTGQLFVYFRKCSTAHPIVAILRIRVRIEPVHMCDCVRTARHAGRIGPASAPPTDHHRTNRYRNAHSIPSTFRSITILSITDGTGYRQKPAETQHSIPLCWLHAIRHVKPCQLPCYQSGTSSAACMRRHTSCTESRHSITNTHRKHRIMHVTTCTTRQKPPNTTGIAEVPPDCACHDTHNPTETPHTTAADRDAGHSHMPGSRIPPQPAQQTSPQSTSHTSDRCHGPTVTAADLPQLPVALQTATASDRRHSPTAATPATPLRHQPHRHTPLRTAPATRRNVNTG